MILDFTAPFYFSPSKQSIDSIIKALNGKLILPKEKFVFDIDQNAYVS